MADVKVAIIKHLMLNTAVVAAFGNRIWADRIPDLAGGGPQPYPHARVWVVTSPQMYSHAGESGRTALVQVDVFDDDVAGGDANTEIIRAALSGYRGMMGTLNAGHVFVRSVAGSWDEVARNYRRIVEVEVGTND